MSTGTQNRTRTLQPGDLLHVWPDAYEVGVGLLPLDEAWIPDLDTGEPVEIELPQGVLSARLDAASACLESPSLSQAFPEANRASYALQVVRLSPPRLRVAATPWRAEPAGAAPPPAAHILRADDLLSQVSRGRFQPVQAYRIGRAAWQLSLCAGFDRLLCLPLLRDVEVMDHQVKAVRTVLRRHRARALLCDEVGLGKTVEAGMVLLELTVRGLARRVLVLTPPSLMEQWHGELSRKFGLDFVSQDHAAFREAGVEAWDRFDRVIASFHTAKREPHRSRILAREYDLVLVDEAHHLRNRSTALWKFAGALRKRFMLLLTATPIQNRLEDIFNLITVLKPGYLSTAESFRKEFVARGGVVPRNLDRLQQILSEVMVRNRRSQVQVRFTRRTARTIEVPLPDEEARFYADVSAAVRESSREGGPLGRMVLRTLQAEAGSSPAATRGTLTGLSTRGDLPEAMRARFAGLAARSGLLGPGAKAETFLRVASGLPDKVVVFTRFRATLELLARLLAEGGASPAVFHGGMPRRERLAALRRFEGDARVLLSSEAGSEGRNLQFCHAVLNYDLPWNPMVLEQRIGRLSRIGQRHDVEVLNLVAKGTLESHLLRLLDVKIRMFELVVGEIDMILGNLDEEADFEDRVMDLWVDSADDRGFLSRLDRLGEDLVRAKEEYIRVREYDDAVFGDRFVPEG